MKTATYYRDLSDDDLLLAGKEMDARPPAYVDALLERFEDLLQEVALLITERDALIDKLEQVPFDINEILDINDMKTEG